MLLEKMLKKYPVEDYYFVSYITEHKYNRVSLVRCENGNYYDMAGDRYVGENKIVYSKPFMAYVAVNRNKLSEVSARKLAVPHYDKFAAEVARKYSEEEKEDITFSQAITK